MAPFVIAARGPAHKNKVLYITPEGQQHVEEDNVWARVQLPGAGPSKAPDEARHLASH